MLEHAGHQTLGWFDGAVHVLPVRVYYQDTDAGGIVYHANYLDFAERSRWEMIRSIGYDCLELQEVESMLFVVKRIEIDYLNPARLGDMIEVRTSVEKVGGASLNVHQSMTLGGKNLANLRIRLGCVDPTAKPRRMPKGLRDRLNELTQENRQD